MITKQCVWVLAAASCLAAACGSASNTGRRLWLAVPRDGTVILDDRQPDPF